MVKRLIQFGIIVTSLIWLAVALFTFGMKVKAASLDETVLPEEILEEDVPEDPVFDPSQAVDIVINLEDESRYCGVSLYYIGEYDGERFTYIEEVLNLVDKDYYKLTRESEVITDAEALATIIPKDSSFERYDMSIVNGEGVAEDLKAGLYLVLQNQADNNVKLDIPYILEAPQWSDETMEYMYDIRYFPKWERAAWFTFRNEIVHPLVLILALISLGLYCLMGKRIVKFALSIFAFVICGYFGMIISCGYLGIEAEFLWMFVLFIVFAFAGVGVLWTIITALSSIGKKMKVTGTVEKNLFWITALTGAIGVFFVLYKMLLNNFSKSIIVAAVCGVIGIIFQSMTKGKEVHSYTYEDLYRIQLKDKEDDERP